MLIDTHAHIYLPEFDSDRSLMLERALAAGVKKILMPNVDLTTVEAMQTVRDAYPDFCYAMMGLHPCSVGPDFEQVLGKIEKLLERGNYLAIGEIGVDLYWNQTYRDLQEEAFLIQVNWARERKLPIVIHSRQSTAEIIEVLEKAALPDLRGVFHCFSGTLEEGRRILDLGFFLGIGGVVTFKNGKIDQFLAELPLDRLLLETDAPYLAPVPYRGKRNECSYLSLVCTKISELFGVSTEEVSAITAASARLLFHC